MTTRRRAFWPATAARRWRRCSSTSRAVAAKPPKGLRNKGLRNKGLRNKRPPNEPAACIRADHLAAPRRRHGAALSLSFTLVVVARPRADLLAGRAALGLGLPAVLHRAELG